MTSAPTGLRKRKFWLSAILRSARHIRRQSHSVRSLALLLAALMPVSSFAVDWISLPEHPRITARAAILMNPDSGRILFSKAPHRRLPPASTTKVLTTLLTLENLDLNARVMASSRAAATEPSRIGLKPGETMYVQDLLYGLMLKSGNDAAEVAAEAVAGSVSSFASLMNAKARQIGARNSMFRNPHGLPAAGHYSTAYDLVLIFRHAMENPVFSEIVRTRQATLRIEDSPWSEQWRLVRVRNTNTLLTTYDGAKGGKTGYTRAAKRCFVGEAQRGSIRLIVAVLGSTRRWQDVKTLFQFGFAHHGAGVVQASTDLVGTDTWIHEQAMPLEPRAMGDSDL